MDSSRAPVAAGLRVPAPLITLRSWTARRCRPSRDATFCAISPATSEERARLIRELVVSNPGMADVLRELESMTRPKDAFEVPPSAPGQAGGRSRGR